MKAFLFSKGETTTDIAKWALARQGFEVVLLYDPKTTFYEKYIDFLNRAKNEDWVVRSDADVIVNKNLPEFVKLVQSMEHLWWGHGMTYCHLRHALVYGPPSVMNSKAIQVGLAHFHEYRKESRPETAFSRAQELLSPRRFQSFDFFNGVHGYKQSDEDIARVMNQKAMRNQIKDWDMELIERMEELPTP